MDACDPNQKHLTLLGHVTRKDSLENLTFTGYIEGKRGRVTHQVIYLMHLCKRMTEYRQ